MKDFHTEMGQKASDKFGVGELNGAFKVGAEWAHKELQAENKSLKAQLDKINTPEIHDFLLAVENEAKHQRFRWPSEHDAGKTNADWFWLIGYVSGKAIGSKDPDKILHHIITTAAVCLNWHAARMNLTDMRPGIAKPASHS